MITKYIENEHITRIEEKITFFFIQNSETQQLISNQISINEQNTF